MPNTDPHSGNFTIPEHLHVNGLSFDGDLVDVHASTENPVAECPLCKRQGYGRANFDLLRARTLAA